MDNHPIQSEIQKASLLRVIKKSARDSYDRLGLVIVLSLVWIIAILIPPAIVSGFSLSKTPYMLIAAVAAYLIGSIVLAGVFFTAYNIADSGIPSISDFFEGIKRFWMGSFALFAINSIVIEVLFINILFFAGLSAPIKPNFASYMAAAFASIVLLFWIWAAQYHLPVLVAQSVLGQRGGVFAAIKKSVLLMLHNPGFTIGLFVVILGFSILCVLTRIGVFLLYAGVVSIVLSNALRELYSTYGLITSPTEGAGDDDWHLP